MFNFFFVTGKTLSATTNITSVHTTISVATAEQIVSKIENDLAAGKIEPKDVERMVSDVSSILTASQPLPPRISNRWVILAIDYRSAVFTILINWLLQVSLSHNHNPEEYFLFFNVVIQNGRTLILMLSALL